MEETGELEKVIIGLVVLIGGGYLLVEAEAGVVGVIGLFLVIALLVRD